MCHICQHCQCCVICENFDWYEVSYSLYNEFVHKITIDTHMNFLISAVGGMGKSTAVKYLAINWAEDTMDVLSKFEFTFYV